MATYNFKGYSKPKPARKRKATEDTLRVASDSDGFTLLFLAECIEVVALAALRTEDKAEVLSFVACNGVAHSLHRKAPGVYDFRVPSKPASTIVSIDHPERRGPHLPGIGANMRGAGRIGVCWASCRFCGQDTSNLPETRENQAAWEGGSCLRCHLERIDNVESKGLYAEQGLVAEWKRDGTLVVRRAE